MVLGEDALIRTPEQWGVRPPLDPPMRMGAAGTRVFTRGTRVPTHVVQQGVNVPRLKDKNKSNFTPGQTEKCTAQRCNLLFSVSAKSTRQLVDASLWDTDTT
jgi:hypothetical protein